MASLDVELHWKDDEVRIVVPNQPGFAFEDTLPKLRELARTMQEDLDIPVVIEGDPERHLHEPEGTGVRVSFASRAQHGHPH